jgi:hypothetical protein
MMEATFPSGPLLPALLDCVFVSVWFGLVWLSYSVSAAVCVAMPGVTGVADSRRGADVSRHRPTSLSKEPSVPRGLPVSGFYLRLCTFRL